MFDKDISKSEAQNIDTILRCEMLSDRRASNTYAKNSDLLELIHAQRKNALNLVILAEFIYCIHGSQISNEHVFSIACAVSKNQRSRIGIKSLDKITSIY